MGEGGAVTRSLIPRNALRALTGSRGRRPGSPLIPCTASQTGLQGDYGVGGPQGGQGCSASPPCQPWAEEGSGSKILIPTPNHRCSDLRDRQQAIRSSTTQLTCPAGPCPGPNQVLPSWDIPPPLTLSLPPFWIVLVPVAPSALTPDPTCNSPSLLATKRTLTISSLLPAASSWSHMLSLELQNPGSVPWHNG